MPEKIIVSQEEIDACKKEYFTKHTYIGTNKPVTINDETAEIVVRNRKRHQSYLNSVHPSHKMTEWCTKIMAPAGTERFYKYRECIICNGKQYYHTAGKFIDQKLKRICQT